jgi:non-ribosomal peptide synthetase component E (peptide arylation enzyme)
MVPDRLHLVERMPVTSNGKVDVRKLLLDAGEVP